MPSVHYIQLKPLAPHPLRTHTPHEKKTRKAKKSRIQTTNPSPQARDTQSRHPHPTICSLGGVHGAHHAIRPTEPRSHSSEANIRPRCQRIFGLHTPQARTCVAWRSWGSPKGFVAALLREISFHGGRLWARQRERVTPVMWCLADGS